MATILANSIVPLWAVILLIVVGGLLVLIIFVLLVRWGISRRRGFDTSPNEEEDLADPALAPPLRKLTVRRGRTVSTSRYLSLTGSIFGLNQFITGTDDNQSERQPTRSRRPFGIWAASLYDRSQSRASGISGTQDSNEKQDYGPRSRSPFGMWHASSHPRTHSRESNNEEITENRLETPPRRSGSPFWSLASGGRPGSKESKIQNARFVRKLADNGEDIDPPSAPQSAYHSHQRSASSSYSLPSMINARELAEDASQNMSQESPGQAWSRPNIMPNLSRAPSSVPKSSHLLPSSPLSSKSAPNLLPMISEASPRGSTISRHPSYVVEKKNSIQMSEQEISLMSKAYHSSLSLPDLSHKDPIPQPRVSRISSSTLDTSLTQTTFHKHLSTPSASQLTQQPSRRPIPALSSSEDTRVTARSPTAAEIRRMSQNSAPTLDTSSPQSSRPMERVATNAEHDLSRRPSKQRNVLRKKSFRKWEMVSRFG